MAKKPTQAETPTLGEYVVSVGMMHNGRVYRHGERIELDEATAADLLALNRIERPRATYNRRDMRPAD